MTQFSYIDSLASCWEHCATIRIDTQQVSEKYINNYTSTLQIRYFAHMTSWTRSHKVSLIVRNWWKNIIMMIRWYMRFKFVSNDLVNINRMHMRLVKMMLCINCLRDCPIEIVLPLATIIYHTMTSTNEVHAYRMHVHFAHLIDHNKLQHSTSNF